MEELKNKIILGDSLEVLKTIPGNSIDSVVTDPPYGLGFMNQEWDVFDKSQFGIAGNEGGNDLKVKKNFNILPRYNSNGLYDFTYRWATECLRVLKPGGHLLVFSGARTYHRVACAIEDAGFEIRDMLEWIYGSGFPKSMNIGKEIDKRQGNQREIIGKRKVHDIRGGALMEARVPELKKEVTNIDYNFTRGNTPWEGWGTALKPAHEPICMARKPMSEKTVADNVLRWGTGGLNIDACRVPHNGKKLNMAPYKIGRFPANLIHDGSQEVLDLFPETISSSNYFDKTAYKEGNGVTNFTRGNHYGYGDKGSASRFFYCAKASKAERELGLDDFPEEPIAEINKIGGSKNTMKTGSGNDRRTLYKNTHPTVKPIALIRYLIRLVTPKQGLVLDPFIGSGTTALACILENFHYLGIEKEEEYVRIAEARIKGLNQAMLSLTFQRTEGGLYD